jgi:hypothetical protein
MICSTEKTGYSPTSICSWDMPRFSYLARRPSLLPVVLLSCAAIMAGADSRGQNAPSAQIGLVFYDIPAQSLASALDAYALTSGMQVLYETASIVGRRSAEAKGQLDPATALKKILNGSGLVARRTDVDAFIIIEEPADQVRAWVPAATSDTRFMGALQNSVLDALCRNVQTRPGNYRIALELWIAPTGIIQRSALIGSTGANLLDRALISALQGLPVRSPPPTQLPQPFILSIAPQGVGGTDECAGR